MHDDAACSLDYLMRFERLAGDFTHVCQQVELPGTPLQVDDRFGDHPFSDFNDDGLVKLVDEEIEHFGYSF